MNAASLSSNIDLERDELVPLAKLIECRLGHRPSPATLWRWRLKGVRIGDKRIRLECVRVGGVWYSTLGAWAAFIAAQTKATTAREMSDLPNPMRTPEIECQLRDQGLL
ncbi:MAG: DUF1580 domain-containing protein [Bryobacterales bacterium]